MWKFISGSLIVVIESIEWDVSWKGQIMHNDRVLYRNEEFHQAGTPREAANELLNLVTMAGLDDVPKSLADSVYKLSSCIDDGVFELTEKSTFVP
jgi:hypothetical protein